MAKTKAQRLASETLARLKQAHPDAHCELDHESVFELLVATVLSAQTTDVLVNKISPDVFSRWPNPSALADAPVAEVERVLSRMGMFRQKAKNITSLAKRIVAEHAGEVPRTLAELVALPGVGRKTANVVLGVAFGAPEGVVVDTHVQRISQRLGWTRETTPEKIERDLMRLFPREEWDPLSHTLIFHGRRVCSARKPACAACPIHDTCPSAFKAENVGRKPPRVRPSNDGGGGARSRAHKKRRPAPKAKGAQAAGPQKASGTASTPAKRARPKKAPRGNASAAAPKSRTARARPAGSGRSPAASGRSPAARRADAGQRKKRPAKA